MTFESIGKAKMNVLKNIVVFLISLYVVNKIMYEYVEDDAQKMIFFPIQFIKEEVKNLWKIMK